VYHKKEVSCCGDDHCFTPLLGQCWACWREWFLSNPPLPSGLVGLRDVKCAALLLLGERGGPVVFPREKGQGFSPEEIFEASAGYEELYERIMLGKAEKMAAGWQVEAYEKRIVDELRRYKEMVQGRAVVLERVDLERGSVSHLVVSGATNSRYFAAGRSKIKRYLTKRIPSESKYGVLMTFTVDPKRWSKKEAYKQIWKEFKRFRDRLRKWRKRKGWRASLGYVAVVEQHKSGYPHLHIAYPGLRYLGPIELLDRWWQMGLNRVDGGMVNALSYVCKYVSKLAGWTEEGMAYLRDCKTRMYSISNSLYRPRNDEEPSGWVFSRQCREVEWRDIRVSMRGLRIGARLFYHVFEGFVGLPNGSWIPFETALEMTM